MSVRPFSIEAVYIRDASATVATVATVTTLQLTVGDWSGRNS